MSKKNLVEEEVDKFKGSGTGKALGWLAGVGKKKSAGNGAGSRVITDADDEKAPFAKGRSDMMKKRENKKASGFSQDVDLPDEKKGKFIGTVGGLDTKGKRFSRPIKGGDSEDPRTIHDDETPAERRRRKSTGSRLVE